MSRFNDKGMMLFPNPMRREKICKSENIIVIGECFCHNGHNLISPRAVFNGFNGIIIKIKKDKREGLVALSPVYGYKSRVSLDIELIESDIWELLCPYCDETLPKYADCTCGGEMIAMFLDQTKDFANCIAVCNRIGCLNAGLTYGNELLTYTGIAQEML
jgi:hypothetical protein